MTIQHADHSTVCDDGTVTGPSTMFGHVETGAVTAGFDDLGIWHDGANGQFARRGWSSAKALALRAIRGAFARDHAKNGDGNPVWLKSADNYLSRVGVNIGEAVRVRYDNDEYGLIDAVHPDGTTKPVRVKWERFADELPDLPHDLLRKALETGPTDFGSKLELEQQVRSAFEHDLGDGWHTSASVNFSKGRGAYVHNAVNHLAVTVSFHRRSDGLGRNAEITPGVTRASQLGIAYRTIALLPDGKIILSNDNIKIKKPAPKGLGTRFLHATESKLAAIGVQEAHVGAMTDSGTGMVGAYVAARQGYDWGGAKAPWELGYFMRQVDPDSELAARLVAPFEKRAAEMRVDEPDFELTRKTLINSRTKFADVQLPDDYPTPNDVAIDPVGKQILLGRVDRNSAGEYDYEAPGGAFTWGGIKRLDVATESTPRVDTPAVTKNTTKTVAGVGDTVRDRIIAAGGTGAVTVADNYLNRHGHPKGSTVTVTAVDDRFADVHGERPLRVKWARFADTDTKEPVPEIGPPPEPFPGVTVVEGTEPMRPLVYPGMVVAGARTRNRPGAILGNLPKGTHVRETSNVDDRTDFDWVINADQKTMRPAHEGSGLSTSRPTQFQSASSTWVVTKVPEMSGVPVKMTDAQQVRVRKALLAAAARRTAKAKKRGDYGTYVDEVAVGAVHPNDWLVSDGTNSLLDTHVSMTDGLVEFRAGHRNGIGPLWRIPSNEGHSNTAILVDTPIEGVQPETITASRVNGVLTDRAGMMLWVDRFTPVRYTEPALSSLTDQEVNERTPFTPNMPSGVKAVNEYNFTPEPYEIAGWIDSQPFSRTIDGSGAPPQLVKINTLSTGKLDVTALPYPLGSPEAEAHGFVETGDALVLPIDDPRLVGALNATWWKHYTDTGSVASTEANMVDGSHMGATVISRALQTVSDTLLDSVAVDGSVRVKVDGNRFVVDPDGQIVPTGIVKYAKRDTDGNVRVTLTPAGVKQVAGTTPPDYSTVLDETQPWDTRIAALKDQQARLQLTHPARLRSWFYAVDRKIESRLDDPTDEDMVYLARVETINRFGAAVTSLIRTRKEQILNDPNRWEEHDSPDIGLASMKSSAELTEAIIHIKDDPAWETFRGLIKSRNVRFRKRLGRYELTSVDGKGDRVVFNAKFNRVTSIDVVPAEKSALVRTYQIPEGDFPGTTALKAKAAGLFAALEHVDVRESATRNAFRDRKKPSAHQLAFTETLEALGIDMGIDPDITLFSGTSSKARKIGTSKTLANTVATIGLAPYPKDWTSTLVARPQRITIRTDGSFARGGGWNRGGMDLHVPHPDKFPQHADTLVHEFGHSMEHTVSGLVQAEQWLMVSRLVNDRNARTPVQTGVLHDRQVWVYPGMFNRSYSARLYNTDGVGANNSFELFTTAMEKALKDPGTSDVSLLEWVTGLLALFRPVP